MKIIASSLCRIYFGNVADGLQHAVLRIEEQDGRLGEFDLLALVFEE